MSFFDPNRYKLWLGDDHLLHLSSTHFSETYKRFYLKDIQAFVISRTNRGKWTNAVLGVLISLSVLMGLLGAYVWKWSADLTPVFIIMTALLALALAVNTLFGPTCRCRINTAVQFEDFPSLGRLRSARKALAILAPAIEACQGKLTAEELEASSEEQAMQQVSQHALTQTATPHGEAGQLQHEDGKAHAVLFGLMFPLAASSFIDIFFQHPTKNLFDTVFFLVILLLAIVSLVRQRESDFPQPLKTTTWALLVSMVVIYIFGLILSFTDMMANIRANTPASPFEPYSPYEVMHEGPVFTVFFLIQAIVFVAFGLGGIIQLFKFRSTYADSQIAGPDDTVPEDASADDASVELEQTGGE